jgi:hypothetical protein
MSAELLFSGPVAGVSFRKEALQRFVHKHQEADCGNKLLWLVAEPDNKFDRMAIRVLADGEFVGYIPKQHCYKIHQAGIRNVKTNFVSFTAHDDEICGLVVEVVKNSDG